jgi:putative ABC transport system permease protein
MIWDAVLLAIRELRRNLMRALLTTLGVVIGVSAVIAMVTMGNGATASISNEIAALGRNVIVLTPFTPDGGSPTDRRAFTIADVAALRRDIGHIRALSPEATATVTAVMGSNNHNTQLTGADEGYFIVHQTQLSQGRPFNDAEIRSGRAVCLLGETVRNRLFGSGDAMDQTIRVKNVPCLVIGLLTALGPDTFGNDRDDTMMMPLRAVQRRINGNNDIPFIWLAADTATAVPGIIKQVQQLMHERRHITPGEKDNFNVEDLAQITQTIRQVTGVMTLFVAAVASVSLLVGGIGIMNIMLVSVTERTREIGIRLAIGARERDVLTQFLVEAVMMSVLGGVIGILLGLGFSYAGTAVLHFPFIPSAVTVVIAFLFSAAIGIGFGFFPARKAARLDPIEALRHE